MTLDDLNKLARDADAAALRASTCKSDAARIARERDGARPLLTVLSEIYRLSYLGDARTALERASAFLRDDLLLIAEADLNGQARAAETEAKAKRAQIAAFFVEPPQGGR